MRWFAALRTRLYALLHRSSVRREIQEELEAHLQHRADDLEQSGLPRAEAERLARVEFGGFEHYREESHAALGWNWFENLGRDLHIGFRILKKSPAFTAAAVITLALGIGANTALFALVRGILLRPFPVRATDRLVVIWNTNPNQGQSRVGPAGRDYLDWRDQQYRSLEDLFLFEHGTGTVTGNDAPQQVTGLRVTTNFGDFFGIVPELGRTFRLDEASARHNLVVLGYRYWQQKYQGDRTVCGRGMTLNGEAYTIIGVLPAKFAELFPADVVVPFDRAWLERADSDLGVFGRLRPRVSVRQASAEMEASLAQITRQRPARKGLGIVLVPLNSVRTEYIRPALLILEGAVTFLLILACVNVANLTLSRGMSRRREIATRVALGAGRTEITRQFLAESLLLSVLGGALGLLLALVALHLWARFGPAQIPVPNAASEVILPPVHLGLAESTFAIVLSFATGICFGLLTPLRMLKGDTQQFLKKRGNVGEVHGRRARTTLIVVEGALALLLVTGACLMIKSFSRLLEVDPGFDPGRLLTLRLKLSADAVDSPYREREKQGIAFHNFLDSVRRVPGVQSAALTTIVPLSQDDMERGTFTIPERPGAENTGQAPSGDYRDISPEYFQTMRIPLLQGRTFGDADDAHHPLVVIVDQTLARQYFGTAEPVGKHIVLPYGSPEPREIVGVVGAVRDSSLSDRPEPTLYFPFLQAPDQSMTMIVRTDLPENVILPAIRNTIASVDRNQPIFAARSMPEIVDTVTSANHIAFVLLNLLALVALLLAAVGIYGVTSYNVAQRAQEVGVRLAFGAMPGAIVSMIVREALILTLLGVGLGLLSALIATRLMSSLLYGISSTDPVTFLEAAGLVIAVATTACYLPARRAVRAEPLAALGAE